MPIIFRSKSAADCLMLNNHAMDLLKLMLVDVALTPQGILNYEKLPIYLERLHVAIADEFADKLLNNHNNNNNNNKPNNEQLITNNENIEDTDLNNNLDNLDSLDNLDNINDKDSYQTQAISLKQRAWPLMDMIKKSITKPSDIIWGI